MIRFVLLVALGSIKIAGASTVFLSPGEALMFGDTQVVCGGYENDLTLKTYCALNRYGVYGGIGSTEIEARLQVMDSCVKAGKLRTDYCNNADAEHMMSCEKEEQSQVRRGVKNYYCSSQLSNQMYRGVGTTRLEAKVATISDCLKQGLIRADYCDGLFWSQMKCVEQ